MIIRELKLDLKTTIHPFGSSCLFLGQRIQYVKAALTLRALIDRTRKNIMEKKPPLMVVTEEGMSTHDIIIRYYYKRVHSYLSLYFRIYNYKEFREMVRV